MITHRWGSYVIQRLILRSEEFRKFVLTYFKSQNTFRLFSNQYASRALQALAESNDVFRDSLLLFGVQNFDDVYSNLASAYLHISCVKLCTSNYTLTKLSTILQLNSLRSLMIHKLKKRFLIALSSVCSNDVLSVIWKSLKRDKPIAKMFMDKQIVYLISQVV